MPMPPRTVHISEADGTAAKYEYLNHPDPIVQKRMQCLRLKYRGFENWLIADVLEISRNTVGNYLSLYAQSGFEGLKVLNYQGPTSKLDKHQPKVEASFRQEPPRIVREASVRIKKLTGIKRSASRVRAFLKRMGMSPLATGQIPAKADPERQNSFWTRYLTPCSKKHKQENVTCCSWTAHISFWQLSWRLFGALSGSLSKQRPVVFGSTSSVPSMQPTKSSLPCTTIPISTRTLSCNSWKISPSNIPNCQSTSSWTTPDTNIANL